MNLTNLHNPYDFANPVSDKYLFVGRKTELDEIKYYLDHAITAPRPINIALLGARASGKTSLLNMTEHEAKQRGFCSARVDLDEDDAKSQLCFFYKLFDVIFSSACEFGAYGGKNGKTFDTYLNLISAYAIPEDKTFCPFLFPLHFAKAMSAGNTNVALSDHNFRNDLLQISAEIKHPIVILFDECNVLSKSRVHLEKMRNIFMNTPGYMLVFTGTPDLFPVMDDVFSPIIRQFKKINVSEFKDKKETEELIRKPLEKIGITPEEIFDFETYIDVNEIHDLCGGRPYEIQLICHILFRRVQNRRARKMKLDLSVLEDVRKELETSQDITVRPILTKLRTLKKNRLSALKLLCACDGCASLDQVWSMEFIFNGDKAWSKAKLKNELDCFVEEGILVTKNGLINFAGDDFDRIYAKYFAREQKVPLNFPRYPLEIFWDVRLRAFFKNITNLAILPGLVISDLEIDLVDLAQKMASEISDTDIFVEGPPVLDDLYFLMLDYRESANIPMMHIKLRMPWIKVHSWCYAEKPGGTISVDEAFSRIETLRDRVTELGGQLSLTRITLPVAPIELLIKKVHESANEQFRNMIATQHSIRMSEEYLIKSNVSEALFNANLALKMNPAPAYCNNLGYLFLTIGEIDKAKNLIEQVIKSSQDQSLTALATYNLGITYLKSGDINKAIEKIGSCIDQIKSFDKKERRCGALLIPEIKQDKLQIAENKRQPDLLDIAVEARQVLESLAPS